MKMQITKNKSFVEQRSNSNEEIHLSLGQSRIKPEGRNGLATRY